MKIETKINLGIGIALMLIVLLTMGKVEATPTPDFDFGIDLESLIDSPTFGLTIQSGDPCDLDLEAVTCADAAAVTKYRKAINDIEVRQLQEEIRVLEREALEDEYGLREC